MVFRRRFFLVVPCALALILSIAPSAWSGLQAREALVDHHVVVTVDPASGRLIAKDTVTGPVVEKLQVGQELTFSLHGALEVAEGGENWIVKPLREKPGASEFGINESGEVPEVDRNLYSARRTGEGPLELQYSGEITHAVTREEEEYARSFSSTPGIISEQGVYLGGSAAWIPTFEIEADAGLFTYTLEATVPTGWMVVSQGDRLEVRRDHRGYTVTWRVTTPTEEAHLIAGKYLEYTRPAGTVEAQVFLREDDPNLAAKYLEVTAQYVQMFSEMIGPYPYQKFALVENFWETGYGMPSFTLLGPQVIRFPFILHSSFPHEILHNWWGNSVYVDYSRGNWCEGLTAYLADHLVKEGQGQGEVYRRDTLKKYRSYVDEGREISLAEFRSRHSGATEAVGYGKSLMLWHMLRRDLGEEKFLQAIRTLYRRYQYARVSFSEIEQVFSEIAGRDLAPFFSQWVERKGAPILNLSVEISREEGQDSSIVIEQVQEADPYHLNVPVSVLYEGSEASQGFIVPMVGFDGGAAPRRISVSLPGGRQPRAVSVDPSFDLFRRLDREEVPASIGEIFGSARALVILPEAASGFDWRSVVAAWDPDGTQFSIVRASELQALPDDKPVWILGSENTWSPEVNSTLIGRGTELGSTQLRFGAESVPRADHCFVVVERHPGNPDLTIGWIGADLPESLPGLARKLPHYGKYSYLAFSGMEPTNVVKGQWSTDRSPLVWRAEGVVSSPRSPERAPLARLAPVFDPQRFTATIDLLTSPRLEGRATGSSGARIAAEEIAKAFAEIGLEPGGDGGGWFQSWTESGPEGPLTLQNVIGILPGKNDDWLEQSVVVGAHYDHLGTGWPDVRAGFEGKIHPGADDNASGVSVLIEVARLLRETHAPSRSVVFVAFDGEEWGRKGSIHYAANAKRFPPTRSHSMISLDAVGRLGGKKLLVLGTGTATEWIHIARGIGFTTGVESTAVADDPGGSDQVSFHEIGIPAVQLTSGPHEDYHRPSDTLDKIDTAGLVKVAAWLREALLYLTEREDPLTSTLGGERTPSTPPTQSGRRVSLGTVPDFADTGPGVRIESVLPDSPAARAGLTGGDRLKSIDGRQITDLRSYANILRELSPGETITIEVERDGETLEMTATLVAR